MMVVILMLTVEVKQTSTFSRSRTMMTCVSVSLPSMNAIVHRQGGCHENAGHDGVIVYDELTLRRASSGFVCRIMPSLNKMRSS